ncbi:RNA-dependent RNA polymerase, eukaryotic-type [Dillenia turbinata]|uniref:RNA-dependent RNA polymerase n=1 Tax=Dillenia turbinata TaxID=194707 RepID=A0AAN8VV08_9MAGN
MAFSSTTTTSNFSPITTNSSSPSQTILSSSVETLLRSLSSERGLPPAGDDARKALASVGEEVALKILKDISSSKSIRTLDGFIFYMIKNLQKPSPTRPLNSPLKRYLSPSSRIDSTAPQSPIRGRLMGSACLGVERAASPALSQQLEALAELEFRKAFLILSYVGRHKLEDAISADEIRALKDVPMPRFEAVIWNTIGQHHIGSKDRRKYLDWDPGRTHLYQCHVFPDGSYVFKGPILSKMRTHLQKVLKDENVLIVKFAEEEENVSSIDYYTAFLSILNEGILVGLRRFRFFVFKDGGKEEKKKDPTSSPVKCFFVRTECHALCQEREPYILSGKSVSAARRMFMHAHTVCSVEKYMARFSLILSKTITLEVDLDTVKIETIDDLPCKHEDGSIVYGDDGEPPILTDGTGFISEDLALMCPKSIYKGRLKNERLKSSVGHLELVEKLPELRELEYHKSEPPLLIQFRLYDSGRAMKGTFLVNKKLQPRTLQVRRSMIKVEADRHSNVQTFNSFEIVATSNQPKKTFLSRHLIALLNYGGVPREYFMDILKNALEDVYSIHFNKRAALRVSLRYGEMDNFNVARMILSGIPLEEPYLQHRLSILMSKDRKVLQGGRLPVSDCYYLMGTTDPTGILKRDEVCIILDNGQVSGQVLVYKHPGLHFGDIHVLNATYVPELDTYVGKSKYAIFFPIKGDRSLADEIANSDFDGDMYWISKNPQLLEYFKASEPWRRTRPPPVVTIRKPSDLSDSELENELFQIFLTTRFKPSNCMGIASDSWLTYIDRLLTLPAECDEEKECLKKKMFELIDIYYDALDAPKTGLKPEVPGSLRPEKLPHYLERDNCPRYKSTSILGWIYDAVDAYHAKDTLMQEIRKLPLLDVEVSQESLRTWRDHYKKYRSEMSAALGSVGESKEEQADDVIQKYKELFYGAAEFEESTRKTEELYDDALAIYHISYEYAMSSKGSVGCCSFAWRVAGPVLCKLYATILGEKAIICLPSVLGEVFG